MKTWHYIAIGLTAYLLFLVSSVPATTIHSFSEQMPRVKIQGVSGTLWNGSAQRVTIDSRHTLDDVNWSFCAWRLITGEICLDLQADYQDKPVFTQLGLGPGTALELRDLAALIDAGMLGQLAALPVGKLAGEISVKADHFSWSQGEVPSGDGLIVWNNASITVAETAKLGTVSILLAESDDYPITATISNKGGDITLAGSANIVDDGNYKLELNLTPNKQASKNIHTSLEMFAKKQRDGSFLLINSGNLQQLGLM